MNARGQGGFNLGNAYGEVIIDPQRAIAGLNQAERGILGFGQRVGGAITGLGNQMASLGGDLTTLTAPMLAFGATGVRTASQYEDALKEIEVRAGLTAEQLEAVRDKTMELGLETQFGPAQAADAFLQLLTSGSSVEEAMLQIDSVLAGASASGSELGYTADALTDIMAAFNLEADQSTNVMQALIDASGASSATFPDLVQGFANIGPMARLMGLDVDETAAILATFSENGIKGAEAGTQLRSMLNNMTRDSAPAREAWNALGIDIFDTNGEIRDINGLIQEMNIAMQDMSDEQRVGIIQDLAGAYGQLGLSALLTTDGYDAMLDKMDDGANITDVAASRLETFSGSISFLRGSVELLQIQTLTPLINEVLRPMVMAIADVVNQVNEWVQANPELANQIVRVLAAVTALGPTLFVAGKALSAIGGIITVISSPLGLLVGAISAVGYAYRENLGGFADFIDDEVLPAIEDIIDIAKNLWKKVQPVLENLAEWFLQAALPAIVAIITDSVLPAIQRFMQFLSDLWTTAQPYLEAFANWFLYEALPAIQTFIIDTVIPAINDFIDTLVRIWQTVAPALTQLANWFINDVMPQIVSIVRDSVMPAIESFINFLSQLWAIVRPHLEAFANWFLYDALPAIQTFISGTVLPAIQGLIDILTDLWEEVSPYLLALANWFLNKALPDIKQFIEDQVVPAVKNFINILAGIWATVQPVLQDLYDWFITEGLPWIQGAIEDIGVIIQGFISTLEGIWTAVQPTLQNLYDWFMANGLPFIEGAINKITNIVSGFINILSGIWEAVRPALESVYEWFMESGLQDIITFIEGAVTTAFEGFIGLVNTLLDGIQWVIDGLTEILGMDRPANAVPVDDIINSSMDVTTGSGGSNVPGLAVGTNYVPEDQLAFLHEGEAVIPRAYNPAAGGMGSGINIGDIVIHANTAAEGRAAAQGFADELDAILERSGLNYSMGAI